MEIIYFNNTDIKRGNFEFVAIYEAMNLKYPGMIKENIKEINFVSMDENALIEVVSERDTLDLAVNVELDRNFFNLNFIWIEDSRLFNTTNTIDYNANLFLNLDDYTTILVADSAFTQEAIDKIIENYNQ